MRTRNYAPALMRGVTRDGRFSMILESDTRAAGRPPVCFMVRFIVTPPIGEALTYVEAISAFYTFILISHWCRKYHYYSNRSTMSTLQHFQAGESAGFSSLIALSTLLLLGTAPPARRAEMRTNR